MDMKLFSDFLKMIFKKSELNYFFRSVSISLIIIFVQFYKYFIIYPFSCFIAFYCSLHSYFLDRL